jgi:hypothetical protein
MICDDCDTVAHCTKHGCVPKQPGLALDSGEFIPAKELVYHGAHRVDPVEDFRTRLADAIDKMPFGDTAQSFAVFVRNFR